jgi:hypothetical protein
MASIFGDESADETAQRVFAVAGLVGTEEQWNALTEKWVVATGGKEFHAAEWETEYANDPDKQKHKQNCRIYAELAQLIAASGLHGWGVAIDLGAYRSNFPHITQEHAYHKCFIETTDRLVASAKGLGFSDLRFTFDHRQGEGNVGALYDWTMGQPEWKDTEILFDQIVGFMSRKNPRIQVADLVARETMKALDNMIGPKKRPMRKSFIALATSNQRLQFVLMMREYFEDMTRKLPAASKQLYGIEEKDFFEWLRKNKVQDNIGTRIRFGMWLDAKIQNPSTKMNAQDRLPGVADSSK